MPLLLVQAFVDTLDRERGTDVLAHATEGRARLAEAGLLDLALPEAGPLGGTRFHPFCRIYDWMITEDPACAETLVPWGCLDHPPGFDAPR